MCSWITARKCCSCPLYSEACCSTLRKSLSSKSEPSQGKGELLKCSACCLQKGLSGFLGSRVATGKPTAARSLGFLAGPQPAQRASSRCQTEEACIPLHVRPLCHEGQALGKPRGGLLCARSCAGTTAHSPDEPAFAGCLCPVCAVQAVADSG